MSDSDLWRECEETLAEEEWRAAQLVDPFPDAAFLVGKLSAMRSGMHHERADRLEAKWKDDGRLPVDVGVMANV